MDITRLNQKSRYIFSAKLAEKATSYLNQSDFKRLVDQAIKICWKWIYTGENVGEVLYNFLDNEKNGFTLFQEKEVDEKKIYAWDCIIDAVAYISRAAYEKEGIGYLPEPIEIVDDNVLARMIHSLILCNNAESEYIENVYQKCLEEELYN